MKTKKVLISSVLATVFVASAGALVACGDGVEIPTQSNDNGKHVVTFDANGGAFGTEKQVTVETDANGKIVAEPTKPTYADHTFKGYTLTNDENATVITLGANGYTFTDDKTVYAKWEADTVVVDDIIITFDVGEHGTMSGEATAKATDGKLASLPDVIENEGWTWNGWYTAATEGEKVTTETVFDASVTVYAQYTENVVEDEEVTITLNVGEGTLEEGAAEKLTTVDGKLESLPQPTPPAGKSFDGWYTAATEGIKVTTDTVFDDDVTIYAQYKDIVVEDNEFTITLNVGDYGSVASDTVKTADGKLAELPEVEDTGDYNFVGWYTAATQGEKVTTDTVFDQDSTIYARYVLKDGLYVNNKLVAELKEQRAEYSAQRQYGATGVELSAGDVVTIIIDGKPLTHDYGTLDLYLATDFNPHGVTLNQENGTFTIKPGEKRAFYIYARYYSNATSDYAPCWSVDFSDGIPDDRPLILDGFYLVGQGFTNESWNLSPDNYIDPERGLIVEFTSTAAKFKITSCNDVDDPSGGRAWDHNVASHYSMAEGSEGLDFSSIDEMNNGKVNKPGIYHITVTGTGAAARFVFAEAREEYLITFDAGDGTFELDEGGTTSLAIALTVNGKLESLPIPTAPTGKFFDAWYTAATNGTKVTTETVFEADSTVYARYKDVPNQEYIITFDGGEHGTCTAGSMQTVNGRLAQLPAVTPDDGYVFVGWYTAAENGDKVTTDYDFTDSIELIALYRVATTVSITTAPPKMHVNGATSLEAETDYDGALAWKSSDTTIATVNSNGVVSAVSPGTATITVTAGEATDTIEVTVVMDYYLRGSMMGWNPAVTALGQAGIIYFTETATPNVYKTASVRLNRNDEFKITAVGTAVNDKWDDDNKYTGEHLTALTGKLESKGGEDPNIICKDTAMYTLTLDLSGTDAVITAVVDSDLPDGIEGASNFRAVGTAIDCGWSNAQFGPNFTYDGDTNKWTATTTFKITSAGEFQFRFEIGNQTKYVDSRVNYTGSPKIDNFDDITGITSAYKNGADGNYVATSAAIGTYSVTMTLTEAGDVESIVVTKQ